ncbi:hypothetical protein Q3V23_13545 [Streptomyces sp. VNUA116]|uniref:hypothetical protein n=1 Tax=Streptomyces sp. VNUA116 TaxID=3062449 RepID=UPI0026753852|nr:hypothetical protein [Streptomyces sp. VNUA116]WKU45011.1 hypothetical protein Q3V23_13545 [Streptomyces sp. VNUA116]
MTHLAPGAPALTPLSRFCLIAGPALIAGYGIIRLLSDSGTPGPGWTAGHLALFCGLALFGPVFLGLRRLAPAGSPVRHRVAAVSSVVALAGLAASLAQAAIDLVVGFRAADGPEMSDLFEQVQSHAAVHLVVYSAGPLLFYAGLVALVAALVSRRGPVTGWTLAAILLGIVVMGVSLDLMPVGGMLFLQALAFVGRTDRARVADAQPVRGAGRHG